MGVPWPRRLDSQDLYCVSAPNLSLVSSLVHQLDVGVLFCFHALKVCVSVSTRYSLSLSSVWYLLWSFCWSTRWKYHRRTGTRKQQPCPLGTRPAPYACFRFIISLFSMFSFLFVSFYAFLRIFFFRVYVIRIRSWYNLVARDTEWYTTAR